MPANDSVELELTASPDPAAVVLPLEVLNAFVGPGTPLRLELMP